MKDEKSKTEQEQYLIDDNSEDISSQGDSKLNIIFHVATVILIGLMIFAMYKGYKMGIFTSQKKIDEFILEKGAWGPFAFVIIQIIQVVIPIIPGGITSIAGVFIFGPLWGTIYNYIGIVIGSYMNYFLARKYGVAFVAKLIGKKKLHKYTKWLHRGAKFDKFFAIAMAVPVAPDDILCLFAGLVRMKLSRFTLSMLFLKPWSLIAYTFGGDFLIKKWLLNW